MINTIHIHSIEKVSHNGAMFKSFKICISLLDVDKVLNNSFWPNGIHCKIWRKSQSKLNNYDGNNYYSENRISYRNNFNRDRY